MYGVQLGPRTLLGMGLPFLVVCEVQLCLRALSGAGILDFWLHMWYSWDQEPCQAGVRTVGLCCAWGTAGTESAVRCGDS